MNITFDDFLKRFVKLDYNCFTDEKNKKIWHLQELEQAFEMLECVGLIEK